MIGRFAETWERKPGRPKKAAPEITVPEVTVTGLAVLVAVDAYEAASLRSDASDEEKAYMLGRHRAQAREFAEPEAVEEPASKAPAG